MYIKGNCRAMPLRRKGAWATLAVLIEAIAMPAASHGSPHECVFKVESGTDREFKLRGGQHALKAECRVVVEGKADDDGWYVAHAQEDSNEIRVMETAGTPGNDKQRVECRNFQARKHYPFKRTVACELNNNPQPVNISITPDYTCDVEFKNEVGGDIPGPGGVFITYNNQVIAKNEHEHDAVSSVRILHAELAGIFATRNGDTETKAVPARTAVYTFYKKYDSHYATSLSFEHPLFGYKIAAGELDLAQCKHGDIKVAVRLRSASFLFQYGKGAQQKLPIPGTLVVRSETGGFSKKIAFSDAKYTLAGSDLDALGDSFVVEFEGDNKNYAWRATIVRRDLVLDKDGNRIVVLNPQGTCPRETKNYPLPQCPGFSQQVSFSEGQVTFEWPEGECGSDTKRIKWINERHYVELERDGSCTVESMDALHLHASLPHQGDGYRLIFIEEQNPRNRIPIGVQDLYVKHGFSIRETAEGIVLKGGDFPIDEKYLRPFGMVNLNYQDNNCDKIDRTIYCQVSPRNNYRLVMFVQGGQVLHRPNRHWKLHLLPGLGLSQESSALSPSRQVWNIGPDQLRVLEDELQRSQVPLLAQSEVLVADLVVPGYQPASTEIGRDDLLNRYISVELVRDPVYMALDSWGRLTRKIDLEETGDGVCEHANSRDFQSALRNIADAFSSSNKLMGLRPRGRKAMFERLERIEIFGVAFKDDRCQVQSYHIAGVVHLYLAWVFGGDYSSQKRGELFEHAYEYLDAAQKMLDGLHEEGDNMIGPHVRLEIGFDAMHTSLCTSRQMPSGMSIKRLRDLIADVEKDKLTVFHEDIDALAQAFEDKDKAMRLCGIR